MLSKVVKSFICFNKFCTTFVVRIKQMSASIYTGIPTFPTFKGNLRKLPWKSEEIREMEGKITMIGWRKEQFEKSVFHCYVTQVKIKTSKRIQRLQKQSNLSSLSCSSGIPVSKNNITFIKITTCKLGSPPIGEIQLRQERRKQDRQPEILELMKLVKTGWARIFFYRYGTEFKTVFFCFRKNIPKRTNSIYSNI